jgi:hypothetical protein
MGKRSPTALAGETIEEADPAPGVVYCSIPAEDAAGGRMKRQERIW